LIALTRLDSKELVVNCDQILTIERTPDTLITFANGDHLLVKDSIEEIVDKTVAFRRRIWTPGAGGGMV
jgi:flagellar protein FlbD